MPKLLARHSRDFRMTARTSSLAPQHNPPLTPDELAEQPRDFHFAITWATLFADLDVIESSGPYAPLENRPTLALVPAPAVPSATRATPAIDPQVEHLQADAAWEMVVPKMVRTAARTFVKPENAETA